MRESFLDASCLRLSCSLVMGLMVHGAQSQRPCDVQCRGQGSLVLLLFYIMTGRVVGCVCDWVDERIHINWWRF